LGGELIRVALARCGESRKGEERQVREDEQKDERAHEQLIAPIIP